MTVSEPSVAISIAVLFVAVCAWLRSKARLGNETRIRQLDNATSLLRSHAEALERFLSDQDAPQHLKDFLLHASDAMGNQAAVVSAVEAITRTGQSVPRDVSEQTKALRADLDELERRHPALARTFETALRTATFGALLRWPESAELFERAVANVEAEPDGELGIAVATAGRGGVMSATVAAA